ncbi:MAG: hypothetical protein NT145_07465 [Elusimicrobia bacterium]|nr:hypothetical protein [Elusimicrobiota bacterium]
MKIKYFILPSIFFLCVSLSYSKEIDLKSNTLEYDDANDFVIAKDSVTVKWKESVLKADTVYFKPKKKILTADKNISLKDNKSILYGDSIFYDYNKEAGEIGNASGFNRPWYFTAKKLKKISEDKFVMKNVKMTSCDFDKPDYTVRATTAKVKVGKRITTYNPVFYFRNIPVFYLPIYVHGMGPHKDSLEVRPGYNNTDGLMATVIYGYPLSQTSYGKLYLDWYGKRGLGEGAEYIYGDSNTSLNLYGFHISEVTTDSERWNTTASYRQMLSPMWTAQAQADYFSDSRVVNNYFQNTLSGSNQKLHSFLSLTRASSKSSLRIVTERYDIYQPLLGAYDPYQITVPRLEYILYPQKGKRFYTSVTTNLQYQYLSTNDYYLASGDMDGNISKDYRFGRKLTLRPKFGIKESWQDRSSKYDFTDILVTRYYTDVNLRYRLKNWIDWDFTHNYRIRSKINQLFPDFDAYDFGREANQISFANSMYLGRISIRNTIGYNFLINRNEIVEDWREKFTNLVNEFTWAPPKNFYFYAREENIVYPICSVRSAQGYFNWGKIEDKYLNFGVFYQAYYPENLDFSTGFGFWPTRKWRLDYSVRTTSLNRFSSFRINDTEIKFSRNIHCWEFKVSYRRRLTDEQIYFNIGFNS